MAYATGDTGGNHYRLAPLSLALFQQVSLVGPVANAIAIPLVTMVVVPITLIWMLLPIDGLLVVAHQPVAWMAQGLIWLTATSVPLWVQHAPPWWTVCLALLGSLVLLAPRGWPQRWLGVVWCLPLFVVTPERPAIGQFSLTVLDIGQGTAAVVRTARHTLVYDTGPRWTDSSDAGSRIIAPYLRASGSSRVSGLVVSHLDIDHSGGANSLLDSVPVDWMLTSVFAESNIVKTAQRRSVSTFACAAGQSWIWDDVRFVVLHPDASSYDEAELKTNDRSCVVKVSTQGFSVLLTADIERASEADIIARYPLQPDTIRSNVLLVPHHGSLTSSSAQFIDAVAPDVAVINAGYRNRFAHPRDAVLSRYAERRIPVLRTDWHGAITLNSVDGVKMIEKTREARQRYWIDHPDPIDKRPLE